MITLRSFAQSASTSPSPAFDHEPRLAVLQRAVMHERWVVEWFAELDESDATQQHRLLGEMKKSICWRDHLREGL